VEDEPSIALVLGDDLRREGFQVEVAADGETASRRAMAEPFDLVILDLMLPKRDGLQVCRDLRSAGRQTPVLMLTARVQESQKIVGFEAGADDYVTKPYSAAELKARIRALLRRSGINHSSVHRFGDCELDLMRCEFRRGDQRVDLTPQEFRLLAALASRPGRAMTRQQLLDAAWGTHAHVTERAVDNQMTNLRKKVEDDPERPRYLSSVRGIGYRFDLDGASVES
jgi:DNA-binding response OmpR family regulator